MKSFYYITFAILFSLWIQPSYGMYKIFISMRQSRNQQAIGAFTTYIKSIRYGNNILLEQKGVTRRKAHARTTPSEKTYHEFRTLEKEFNNEAQALASGEKAYHEFRALEKEFNNEAQALASDEKAYHEFHTLEKEFNNEAQKLVDEKDAPIHNAQDNIFITKFIRTTNDPKL